MIKRTRAPAATPQPEAEVTVLDAVNDPQLFAPWFQRGDWRAWRAFLAALFGLPLEREAAKIYRKHTRRRRSPRGPFAEAWLAVGRRGGKSFIAALVAVYLACFRDYRPYLQPGERGTVLVIASDRRQARTILRYVRALVEGVPMLARMIERQTAEGIDLATRVSIEIHTCSFRRVRGYTIVAALLDEVAFWRTEDSAEPDHEIVGAIRPGMATIPGAMLLGLSSPYAKRGVLYEAHKNYHGRDHADVLVWQAPTRTMNPTVPERVVKEAMARDEAWARAEYLAEFRADIEAFLPREVVEAAMRDSLLERPYDHRFAYTAFADPAGGGSDEFALAIGHREDEHAIVDVLRARHGKPASIVEEFAKLLKAYGISGIQSDRYAGSWPADEFARHGITCTPSAKAKSDLYLDTLATLNSERAELPPDDRLLTQFTGLERRTSRGGRDSIDHGPGGHDDRANACAGLIVMLTQQHELTVDDFEMVSVGYGSIAESERVWHPAGSISEAIHPDDDHGWGIC